MNAKEFLDAYTSTLRQTLSKMIGPKFPKVWIKAPNRDPELHPIASITINQDGDIIIAAKERRKINQ